MNNTPNGPENTRREAQKRANESTGLPALLKPAEVAELLRKNVKTIYNWKCDGKLPGVVQTNPGRFLVRRDVLLEWLRRKTLPSSED